MLGVDTLREYDIKAPLAATKVVVPFPQAVDWICAGMQPLGEEYVDVLRRGCLAERWVDIYPNKGKRLGAFSYGGPGTHPFVMMSYNDDLVSASTLAHELGHALHSHLSWKHQPLIYARYTLFAAEVASNFNQAMVRDYLLRTQTSRDFQIGVIEEAMSNFHRYFFVMPTLARFELAIHERAERGQPLTSDGLNNLMADLFAEGYGDDLIMDRQRTGITWAAVLDAPLLEFLCLPVRHRHCRRTCVGQSRARARPRRRRPISCLLARRRFALPAGCVAACRC